MRARCLAISYIPPDHWTTPFFCQFISAKMFRNSYLLAILQSVLCASATTYNWNVGWITENPDGLHPRPVITINGQWPPPTLSANVGETVTINLKNNLGNETTGLHFHGLFQNGTNSMDGPTQVTQCPIGPGETFTQTFQASLPSCRHSGLTDTV